MIGYRESRPKNGHQGDIFCILHDTCWCICGLKTVDFGCEGNPVMTHSVPMNGNITVAGCHFVMLDFTSWKSPDLTSIIECACSLCQVLIVCDTDLGHLVWDILVLNTTLVDPGMHQSDIYLQCVLTAEYAHGFVVVCIAVLSRLHYNDVIMGAIAFQITSLTIIYSTVYSDADQRKHQSSASLAFVRGIHRNSPHKWPVTRKMFPFDDVIMDRNNRIIAPVPQWSDSKGCGKIYRYETYT